MIHRSKTMSVLLYLVSFLVILVSVYPFVYAVSTSLKTEIGRASCRERV